MEQQSTTYLTEERVGKLMRRYALPCVISLLVGALYNIVDQIYIGWGVGYLGNGATNVVFPLTVLALALATMIGDGACSFVSIRRGAGDGESARRGVGSAVTLCAAAGLVLTAAYVLGGERLLRVFGATDANLSYAQEYFSCICIGIPFYMFANTMNPIIRSDGSPRFAMVATLSGAVLNVILDAVAIFVLGWGMRGAALATVAGQLLSAGLSLYYLFTMRQFRLRLADLKLRFSLVKRILALGFCSFLSQASVVVAMAVTNNALVRYGALSAYGQDIPLTVLGIVMKVFQIVISISIGMAAGCIPIVGYNVGAGRSDRARAILWRLVGAEALLGVIALIVVELFPDKLTALFGGEGGLYLTFALRTFRIYLCMLPLACVNKASFIFLQSLGKAGWSSFLSLLREVLLAVPLVLLLPKWFGLDGVLYSMPTADLLAGIVCVAVLITTARSLSAAGAAPVCKPVLAER